MKSANKLFLFIPIITSVLYSYGANAATKTKVCPAGLFCTNNGTYSFDPNMSDGIQAYQMGPAELVTENWGDWTEEGLCSKSGKPNCTYSADKYDALWVSTWFGFYFLKDGNVTYRPSSSTLAKGAFPCPGTYPSSAEGSTSVFQCYKVVSNGKKEYYQAPKQQSNNSISSDSYDTDSINALVQNLQSALSQANKAAQDLQNILNNTMGTNQKANNPSSLNNQQLTNKLTILTGVKSENISGAVSSNTNPSVTDVSATASSGSSSTTTVNSKNKSCNDTNQAGKGLYCANTLTKPCPEGCYCSGGGKVKWSESDINNGCKTKSERVTTELNQKGIFLCPEGTTSKLGASTKSDCFKDEPATANAKNQSCHKDKLAGKGLYCASSMTKECPEGCYCTGGDSFKWKEFEVKNACKDGSSKISELNTNGVYLCPKGQTSKPGASSVADCFEKETTGVTSKNKPCSNNNPAGKGLYCGAMLTKECPEGCYCTGGGNFTWTAGEVQKGCKNRWSKITDELNKKGVFLCPEGKTSKTGAKSASDCFTQNSTTDAKSATVPVARTAISNTVNRRTYATNTTEDKETTDRRPITHRSAIYAPEADQEISDKRDDANSVIHSVRPTKQNKTNTKTSTARN